VAVKVSFGQTVPMFTLQQSYTGAIDATNFWCTKVQIFGRGGKKIDVGKKKGGFKKEKGDSLFLEKRNP
jgi:hypothetical protein